jgi:hypothetical protein
MSPTQNGHNGQNGHNANGIHQVVPAIEEHPPSVPELAEWLSPSQCATYISCSARWWYKYGLTLDQAQGSALSIGRSLHSTVRTNFEQKISSFSDLPLTGLLAVYEDEWAKEAAATQFRKDEDRDQLRLMGRACWTTYMEKTAPLVQPAQVEMAVSGKIGGVNVRGFVDILDVHGRIIDLKSAKTSPAKGKIRPDYRFQISTYEAITPGASGEARLDTIVKLKSLVKHVPQNFTVGPEDRRHVEVMYPLVQEGMRSGIYTPNRNNYLCSKKYCNFWRQCISDFGGAVDGDEE